jgi:hypothetical protein
MVRKLLPLILILALGLTACGFSFELPSVTPGATLVDPISVTQAEDTTTPTHLVLSFGAGELNLAPGADGLVTGTASYNVVDFKPEITNTGNTVNITQGNYTLNKIPNFGKVINTWDLKLGTTPIDLEISAGAYKASLELGDLALTNLTVKDGASDVDLVFTNPNHTEMNLLRYETGASQVSLKGLSYANFSMLEFKGGAGNYSLDFSGELQRNASVSINTGLGNLTLVIPDGVPVQMTIDGNLANINIAGAWTKSGNMYTQAGTGPMLTIVVEIGAANLVVTSQ